MYGPIRAVLMALCVVLPAVGLIGCEKQESSPPKALPGAKAPAPDTLLRCPVCDAEFPAKEAKPAGRSTPLVSCPKCGESVPPVKAK